MNNLLKLVHNPDNHSLWLTKCILDSEISRSQMLPQAEIVGKGGGKGDGTNSPIPEQGATGKGFNGKLHRWILRKERHCAY